MQSFETDTFRALVEQSIAGIYVIQDNRLKYANPTFCDMFGYAVDELARLSVGDLVHPEDRDTVHRALCERMEGDSDSLRYAFRGLRKDGSTIWVEVHGVATEYGGRPAVSGLLIDVTEVIKTREVLRAKSDFAEAVIGSLPGIFYLLNEQGQLEMDNAALVALLGYAPHELRRLSIERLVAPKDAARLRHAMAQVHETGYAQVEADLVHKDRTTIPFLLTGRLLETAEGPKLVGVGLDLTERKRLEDQLRRLATTDPLTGLMNRRAFMEAAGAAYSLAARQRLPITVMMIDADHFKRINDTYGHEAGDEVLRAFARIVRQTVRASDIAGRLGGEEFCLVLPETGCGGAQTFVNRLLARVRAATVAVGAAEISFSVSIGWHACLPENGPAALRNSLRDADRALYLAKTSGRNRAVAAAPDSALERRDPR